MADEPILVTIAIQVRGITREQARAMVKDLRQGVHLNALSQLERLGIEADELGGALVVYAPTMSWPLPLEVSP